MQQENDNPEGFEPSYLALHRNGRLAQLADEAVSALRECRFCPRDCGVNRLEDAVGYCCTGRLARLSSYNPHFGEEAPLVGSRGSGTIFFGSCNMFCTFCQNYDISHENYGTEVDKNELASAMLCLQGYGCHNINLVSPSHVVPQILEALDVAAGQGLNVPLVYNTGCYDSLDTIRLLLDGVVDIYMPDFKFWDNRWAEEFASAPDYRQRAMEAIREMQRQVGDLVCDSEGNALRGLLVRHLVMPENIAGTEQIVKFLAEEISPNTHINILGQYHPCGTARAHEIAGRRPTSAEIQDARKLAEDAGLKMLDRWTNNE